MENDNVNDIKKLPLKEDHLSIGLTKSELKCRPLGLIFRNLTFFYDYQRSKISIWTFKPVIVNLRSESW